MSRAGDIVEGQFDDAEEDTPSLGLAQSAQNEKVCTQSRETGSPKTW